MLRKRFPMPKLVDRNPESARGDWYFDTHCIDCAASREVAPGLVMHRHGKSVFGRQPANEEEEFAAWRAVLAPLRTAHATYRNPFKSAAIWSGLSISRLWRRRDRIRSSAFLIRSCINLAMRGVAPISFSPVITRVGARISSSRFAKSAVANTL